MFRRRRNVGHLFDDTDHAQSVAPRQIGKCIVIGDDRQVGQRRETRLQILIQTLQPGQIDCRITGIRGGVGWIDGLNRREKIRHHPAIEMRVEPDVRIDAMRTMLMPARSMGVPGIGCGMTRLDHLRFESGRERDHAGSFLWSFCESTQPRLHPESIDHHEIRPVEQTALAWRELEVMRVRRAGHQGDDLGMIARHVRRQAMHREDGGGNHRLRGRGRLVALTAGAEHCDREHQHGGERLHGSNLRPGSPVANALQVIGTRNPQREPRVNCGATSSTASAGRA